MKIDASNGIIKGLPLAILVTFFIQGGAAIWWVSARARDGVFIERRVERLEAVSNRFEETRGQTLERLARIEERLSAQTLLLARIDKQLSEISHTAR